MAKRLSGIVLSAGLLGAVTGAAKGTGPQKPAPAAELKQLEFFRGEWMCTGHMGETAGSPAHNYEATIRSEPLLDGHWYQVDYVQKATPQSPEFVARGTWGWVPQKKQFTRSIVDNMGGFDQGTSPGWQGDRMTWLGDCNCTGEMAPFRHTFTRMGDTQMKFSMEVKTKGQWQPFIEDTCKKTGKMTQR